MKIASPKIDCSVLYWLYKILCLNWRTFLPLLCCSACFAVKTSNANVITLTKPQVNGSNIDIMFNTWHQVNYFITVYYLQYNEDQKLETLAHVGGHQAQAKRNTMNNYFTSLENPNWLLSHLNWISVMKAEPWKTPMQENFQSLLDGSWFTT